MVSGMRLSSLPTPAPPRTKHGSCSVIADKVAKHYGSRAWLVVYLNIGEWGIRQAETELYIAQIKQKHANSFAGIFVIWKDKLL